MKISKADKLFSQYIRSRAKWICQRCGRKFKKNGPGLHCAHYWSRGRWITRFNQNNAIALCFGCHRYIDTHKEEKNKLFKRILGNKFLQLQTFKGMTLKDIGKTKKEIETEAIITFKII